MQLPKKGPRYKFFVTGDDRGEWELSPDLDWGALKAGKWQATASLSRQNDWRNLSVDNATEHHQGFRKAIRQIVKKYPEMLDWVVSFDGPYMPVRDLVGGSDSSKDLSKLVFFHGTSLWAWKKIQKEGLRPRGATNVDPVYGMAVGAAAGRKEGVYLTTQMNMARAAARDASNQAFKKGLGRGMVVLKVRGLDPKKMLPDEDSKKDTAQGSLESMGSIAYVGEIPASKISLHVLEEGSLREGRSTFHGRNGRFTSAGAAHTVTKDGERYRMVRQLRRIGGKPEEPQGSENEVLDTVEEAKAKQMMASFVNAAPGWTLLSDLVDTAFGRRD